MLEKLRNDAHQRLKINGEEELEIGVLDVEEFGEMLVGQVAIVYINTVSDACIFEDQALDAIQFAAVQQDGHEDIREGI